MGNERKRVLKDHKSTVENNEMNSEIFNVALSQIEWMLDADLFPRFQASPFWSKMYQRRKSRNKSSSSSMETISKDPFNATNTIKSMESLSGGEKLNINFILFIFLTY